MLRITVSSRRYRLSKHLREVLQIDSPRHDSMLSLHSSWIILLQHVSKSGVSIVLDNEDLASGFALLKPKADEPDSLSAAGPQQKSCSGCIMCASPAAESPPPARLATSSLPESSASTRCSIDQAAKPMLYSYAQLSILISSRESIACRGA